MVDTAPIFDFNDARTDLVRSVIDRMVDGCKDPMFVLNDAAYHEIRRLEKSRRKKDIERLEEWQRLARSLSRMSQQEREGKLRELVEYYAWDVAGNFDKRVYKTSIALVPPLVTSLLAPRQLFKLARRPAELFSLNALDGKVKVEGPLEKLREVQKHGTVVYVPTHLSNMDSIVFGFALERAGLAPATYGAGKNLFTNPVLSFFMHNLGAYRVDRRLRHVLYKDVLKTYSTVLVENGYHSLFFPGGTRSRSGGIERKLKLGLVGSAIEAYTRTVRANRERRVFFVPATINYLITLEAETLIEDFLSEAGKGRYIIEDDESSRLGRVSAFAQKLLGMEGSVVIRFSDPVDPFGNKVDETGRSFDGRGREVDPAGYVKNRAGEAVIDAARDAQYTRELGEVIMDAYERDTVIMSTHLVAAACFDRLRRAAPRPDLFAILRLRDALSLPRDELAADVVAMRDKLLKLRQDGRVALGTFVADASGGDIVERALRAFAGYHTNAVLTPRRDGIGLTDPNLIFYYQNRLAAHGLGFNALGNRAAAPLLAADAVAAPAGGAAQ